MFKHIILATTLVMVTGCDQHEQIVATNPASLNRAGFEWLQEFDWTLEAMGVWVTETPEGGEIRFAETPDAISELCAQVQAIGFENLEDSDFHSEKEYSAFCENARNSDQITFRELEPLDPGELEPPLDPGATLGVCTATFGASCACDGGCQAGIFKCKCLEPKKIPS